MLLSGDRLIVLGITRATLPKLTLLKRAATATTIDYVWVDVTYADYINRVYSLPAREAIIVIRPKKDLFWTDQGRDSVDVWVGKIERGEVVGRSSVGGVMRMWKWGIGVGEDFFVWFAGSVGMRGMVGVVFVVGCVWFFVRMKKESAAVKGD